jgi:iron(III) transport system substrate-binding protein
LQEKSVAQVRVRLRLVALVALIAITTACRPQASQEVVVYTALDQEFSEPIFDDFTRETGIVVRAKYDTEANKTVGLVNLILSERNRPRCDLFWNNEPIHTLRLAQAGLLRAAHPVNAASFPAEFQSASGLWFGFAARARVLLVNRQRVTEPDSPRTIRDLADPRWQGAAGIARPLFGTTATHAVCLFEVWEEAEARQFLEDVKGNAQIFPGNRQVAQAVGSGQLAFGLTDTDDAIVELEQGSPVRIVYPDQQEGGLGTLLIPNALCLVAGGPRPVEAEQLLNYLLSAQVEQRLAEGPSAQIPLHRGGQPSPRLSLPPDLRAMQVDFAAAAERWEAVANWLRAAGF